MKSLHELTKRVSAGGDRQLYRDNKGNRLMLYDFLGRLEWIQLIDSDFQSTASESYRYNSNLGQFKVYYYGGEGYSFSGYDFDNDGNLIFRKNETFTLDKLVNQQIPLSLQEKINEAVNKNQYLLFADAKAFVWHLHFKTKEEYFEWWDKEKPQFLPRNPEKYYATK